MKRTPAHQGGADSPQRDAVAGHQLGDGMFASKSLGVDPHVGLGRARAAAGSGHDGVMPRGYGRRARSGSVAARSGSEMGGAAPGGPPRSPPEVDAPGSTPGTGAPASGKTPRTPTASLLLLRAWAGRQLSGGHAA